jgi:hypothetical protein
VDKLKFYLYSLWTHFGESVCCSAHSKLRHEMKVKYQLHAPAALSPERVASAPL